MPDFNFKSGTFPIAEVISAAQRKSALEQQARTEGNQQLLQGLTAIGQVGQSLVDKRMQVAQALALGKQFGIDENQAKLMEPEQILKVAAVNKGMVDADFLKGAMMALSGRVPTTSPASAATPASTSTPAPGGAMLTGGPSVPAPTMMPAPVQPPSVSTGTMAVPVQAPPLRPRMVNPATAKIALDVAKGNAIEPVITRSGAEAQGGVKHGTHILPDEKGPKDIMDPKYQADLEKQYTNNKMKALSNRSGGLGLQDSKVNQAIDLRKMINKYYDPKTGEYAVPPSLHAELALGLARLLSPGGQVGIELMHELRQSTGREALSKALIYAGADPSQVGGATQSVVRMFVDSVDRQGETAEQLRDQYMQYISDNAPTDLEPARKSKHDQSKLNSFNSFLEKSPDQHSQQSSGAIPQVGETFNGAKVLSVKRVK